MVFAICLFVVCVRNISETIFVEPGRQIAHRSCCFELRVCFDEVNTNMF